MEETIDKFTIWQWTENENQREGSQKQKPSNPVVKQEGNKIIQDTTRHNEGSISNKIRPMKRNDKKNLKVKELTS